jgi:hypothetical protein
MIDRHDGHLVRDEREHGSGCSTHSTHPIGAVDARWTPTEPVGLLTIDQLYASWYRHHW